MAYRNYNRRGYNRKRIASANRRRSVSRKKGKTVVVVLK